MKFLFPCSSIFASFILPLASYFFARKVAKSQRLVLFKSFFVPHATFSPAPFACGSGLLSLIPFLFLLSPFLSFSQEPVTDTIKPRTQFIEAVMVSSTRATGKTPVTFSNLTKKEIEARNLGQDIPMLVNFLPGVVTTSDAGNGFGYTGIRVRGSDATRVNVTINGIPYNDSETSGTYFVDLPDFASSLENIQLQRGVGTSTNGAGAFGASLNLLTEKVSDSARGEIANSYGSFNSRKHTVKFSTGLMNEHFEIAGRLSLLHSDGYIDRAESDMKSYFLQGTFIDKNSTVKALVFGGNERTYQSWFGVDAVTLESDPTFNFAGMYTDEFGNTRFYEDEVDDYTQNHFQLHWNEKISDSWNSNIALHYTKGKGYYENYQQDADLESYGMSPVVFGGETLTSSDLVRRKWLDNDFYGMTFSANHINQWLDLTVGGALNNYEGIHFGEVVWSRFASTAEPDDRYYDQNSTKTDFNIFTKAYFKLTDKLSLFGDIQFRTVKYDAELDSENVNRQYSFFNPKAGLTFSVSKSNNLYFSFARAHKEPTRTDFENGIPEPEQLDDIELGWRHSGEKVKLNANLYLMYYKNQLVKTGSLDDVGNEINANVDASYRAGIEIDAALQLSKKFSINPNLAVSTNKIKDYIIVHGDGVQYLGTTNISFSPNVVAGMISTYRFTPGFGISLLNKYVGEQYAGNIDTEITKLESYTVTDLNLTYELKTKWLFRSVLFTGLINNLFDAKYVSNAYLYGEDYLSYFPQAGTNFLVGLTLKF